MIGEWGAAAGSQSLVHKLLVMVAYFEGVLYLLKFSIKVVGGSPDDLELRTTKANISQSKIEFEEQYVT